MAFTLSHMVIAPAIYPIFKKKIPLASLAIGAATPDLPRLLNQSADFSHSWSGAFSIDILIGLLLCTLWYGLYRPYGYCLLQRNAPSSDLPASYIERILLCAIGIALGAVTHLIWDGFTHDDFRNFAARELLEITFAMPFSSHEMPLFRLLQYASSMLALPFLYYLIRPVLLASKSTDKKAVQYVQLATLLAMLIACGNLFSQFNYLKNLFFTDTYFFYGESFVIFSRSFILCISLFAIGYRLLFFKQD